MSETGWQGRAVGTALDTAKKRAVDLGYAAGWRLVRGAPAAPTAALFRAGADLATRRGGAGARQLRANLRRVCPSVPEQVLDELVRDGMRSYARYWWEAFRLPSMDHVALRRDLDPAVSGQARLDAALDAGRGAVVALPHSGNWDLAGVWLVGRCGGFTTVAERLRPESLYRRFVAYRESLGFEILPMTGAAAPFPVLAARLRANRVVCLLADRDLHRSGVPVRFFGEPTRMPAGPARLAAATGAALLPVGCWFTPDGWGFRIHPPVPVPGPPAVPASTQTLADAFAADIAAHPADWHMLARLWPADLPADRQADPVEEAAG